MNPSRFLQALAVPVAVVCSAAAFAVSETRILHAAEFGVTPESQDNGEAVLNLLKAARESGSPCRIVFAAGEYHFRAESALPMHLYISNHDQQPIHPVALPLVKMKQLEICGNGARFVFHGKMLPIVVMDSESVTLRDLSIDYAEPFSSEGRITEISGGYTTLEMSPASKYAVENGNFLLTNNGRRDRVQCALAFEADGRMVPTGRYGDMAWPTAAESLPGNRVRFATDARKKGLTTGQTLVLRSYYRPHPGMLLYRAKDTELHNVIFHDSQGMALIAQRSENITIRGGGCIRARGRMHTTAADATHFSNCRGHIDVSGATYEAMMDDAINVHATCLGIVKVEKPGTFIARYMHGQAYGFEVMQAGEQLQFIHGPTLELNPRLCKVAAVEVLDPRHIRVTLEGELPEGIGAGDAVENADWHPSVSFHHNTVRHNRARGALFTTPRPVRVYDNHFDHTHGSAILLAGDAQGWYESGACRDVIITGNTFRHGLTGLYQFTDALIAICPEVRKIDLQKEAYHRNISIVANKFITHRVPLLSATSAEKVEFKDNHVEYHDIYPQVAEGAPFLIKKGCHQIDVTK